MVHDPQLGTQAWHDLSEILACLFLLSETYKMIPKSMWRFRGLVLSQTKTALKDSTGEHSFPHFKTLSEAAVAKTVKQMDQQNRRPEAKLAAEKSNNLWQQCWTTGQTHEKEQTEAWTSPHVQNPQKCKVSQRLKRVCWSLEESQASVRHDAQITSNKRNIWPLGRHGSEKLMWLSVSPRRQCTQVGVNHDKEKQRT